MSHLSEILGDSENDRRLAELSEAEERGYQRGIDERGQLARQVAEMRKCLAEVEMLLTKPGFRATDTTKALFIVRKMRK